MAWSSLRPHIAFSKVFDSHVAFGLAPLITGLDSNWQFQWMSIAFCKSDYSFLILPSIFRPMDKWAIICLNLFLVPTVFYIVACHKAASDQSLLNG